MPNLKDASPADQRRAAVNNARQPISDAANMGRNYLGRNDEVVKKMDQITKGQPMTSEITDVLKASGYVNDSPRVSPSDPSNYGR